MIEKNEVRRRLPYTCLKCRTMFPMSEEDRSLIAPEFGAYIGTKKELRESLVYIIAAPICLVVFAVLASILAFGLFVAINTIRDTTNELTDRFYASGTFALACLFVAPFSPFIEAANTVGGLIADNPAPTPG